MPKVTIELSAVDDTGVAPISYTIEYPEGHALQAAHSLRYFTSKIGPNMLYGLAQTGDQPLLDYLESVGIHPPAPEPDTP